MRLHRRRGGIRRIGGGRRLCLRGIALADPLKIAGSGGAAGQRLAVRDGAASITYADFVKGKHEPAIWLYRKGKAPVPGALTFE